MDELSEVNNWDRNFRIAGDTAPTAARSIPCNQPLETGRSRNDLRWEASSGYSNGERQRKFQRISMAIGSAVMRPLATRDLSLGRLVAKLSNSSGLMYSA